MKKNLLCLLAIALVNANAIAAMPSLDAVQNSAQFDPRNNPSFKKMDSNTYICSTTINHPEACISNDAPASPVVNDVTGGSIN